jgi:ankyrin repeat protein
LTALLLACDRGYEKIVSILLENHANTEIKTKEDWTALHYAACNGYDSIVKLLLAHGANPDALTKVSKLPFRRSFFILFNHLLCLYRAIKLHYIMQRKEDKIV